MKKLSKLLSILALSLSLTATLGVTAFAGTTYPDGGKLQTGIYSNNGYYMGYSYYYHGSRTHRSSVALDGTVYRSSLTAPGYTSCANSPSTRSLNIQCYYSFN